ncbi:hypothetical protein EAG_01119 [Camponotus floridanus]|uniref:Uncharacterized protein n=1 Tax=Camponotus floridanus TaxID=104421 RepID=E2ABA3_CAMFO|nr:hypothetical protein EAG_01119 [Camponotus floridanus]
MSDIVGVDKMKDIPLLAGDPHPAGADYPFRRGQYSDTRRSSIHPRTHRESRNYTMSVKHGNESVLLKGLSFNWDENHVRQYPAVAEHRRATVGRIATRRQDGVAGWVAILSTDVLLGTLLDSVPRGIVRWSCVICARIFTIFSRSTTFRRDIGAGQRWGGHSFEMHLNPESGPSPDSLVFFRVAWSFLLGGKFCGRQTDIARKLITVDFVNRRRFAVNCQHYDDSIFTLHLTTFYRTKVYHVTRGERDTNRATLRNSLIVERDPYLGLYDPFRMRLHSAVEYILPLTSFLLSPARELLPPPKAAQWSSLLEGNLPSSRETFYDPERPDKIATVRWISLSASRRKTSDGSGSIRDSDTTDRDDLLFIQCKACTNLSCQNGTGRYPLIGYYASALSAYSQCIARCSMFTGITLAKSTIQTFVGSCTTRCVIHRCKLQQRRQGISRLRSGNTGPLEQYGLCPFIRLFRAASQKLYLDRTHAAWHEFRKRRAASLLEGLASAAIVKVGALTREGGALYTVRSLFVRARQEVMTASSRHEAEELPGEHSAHVSERVEVCQGISYHNYFRLRQTSTALTHVFQFEH